MSKNHVYDLLTKTRTLCGLCLRLKRENEKLKRKLTKLWAAKRLDQYPQPTEGRGVRFFREKLGEDNSEETIRKMRCYFQEQLRAERLRNSGLYLWGAK